MGKKSFIRMFIIYLLVLTGLLLGVVWILMISSYGIIDKEIKETSNAFITIYSNEVENSISELDGTLKNVASQKVDLAKIKSHNENEKTLAAISLHTYMKSLFINRVPADAIIVYENYNDICLDMISSSVNYTQKEVLRDFTKSTIDDPQVESSIWNFIRLDGQMYLYKVLKTSEQAIAVYIESDNLLTALKEEENGNRSIFLVNNEGEIGKIWGNETIDIVNGGNISAIHFEKYYNTDQKIVEGQLFMYCLKNKSDFLKQASTSMIIVMAMAVISFLFMLLFLKYTRAEIIRPMQVMIKDILRIKQGDYHNRIDADFKTHEFQMLKDTTNDMVDEIVGLKIQTYEKKIELQDMELHSIRLQLKPHFFLNALTTISSLSSQNKNEQIRQYISSLSRNVRYMFRAGLHTVTVLEEIKHVINYFEMQELKYPNCIFHMIDLPKELEEWKIPQMLIHTFVENEYKYAVSLESTLTLLIKISNQVIDEEEMLMIEIEDDGKGYPQEVLNYMNGITEKTSDKGTRIGLWSIKNMMELMYERKGLVILENISPHGCVNRIYIPKTSRNERKIEQY